MYGSLPGGLSIASQSATVGRISGTPSGDPDQLVFTIKALDANGNWGEKQYTMYSYPLTKPTFGSITAPVGATQIGLYKKGHVLAVFDDLGNQLASQDCGPGFVGSYDGLTVVGSATAGGNLMTLPGGGWVLLGVNISTASYDNPVTVSTTISVAWSFQGTQGGSYSGIAISLTVPTVPA